MKKTKIIIAVIASLTAIQFIPLPGREYVQPKQGNDITDVLPISDETEELLRATCYDCHSDETRYPWYADIAPLSWWVQHHVNEGREHLNFSHFGELSMSRRDHRLEEGVEMMKKEEMPLSSYTWMHPEAKISLRQRAAMIDFFSSGIAGGAGEEEGDKTGH